MALSRGDVVAGAFEVEQSLEIDNAVEVYRARHLISGKRVTLKILRLRIPWCDATIERAKRLHEVACDASVRCIHQGPAGRGRWCFAFEWLASDDPETKLPRAATVEVAAMMGARLADGLAALHEHGLAHGHVRPERVVMVGRGALVPKLADFVVAPERMLLAANAPYVAPEVLLGASVTPEADVYALGVMLWELVLGRAFSSSRTRLGVLLEALFDAPDDIDGVDPAFASWIARMMAFEPLERPEARQVEAALSGLADARPLPVLSPPATRDEIDGRRGTALAVLVVRPPPGKEPSAVGLDAEWRRDVEGLGLQLQTLSEGTLVGRIRGRTANAVAVSAGLVARATQECAFRASVVAGLLDDAETAADASDDRQRARIVALRAEIEDIANVASRTPASVTRFTARLAERVGSSIGLKPSADSFLLAPPSAPRPKRGGTLEIDTTATKASSGGKRRKTGEIEIDERKPARGKGGTLVIEPGPGKAANKASAEGVAAAPPPVVEEPSSALAATEPLPAASPEPRRGKLDTLVIETDPAIQEAAIQAPTIQAPAIQEPAPVAPEAPAESTASPQSTEITRVAPLPTKAAWGRNETPSVLPGSETPTLEIEVSEELVELSKVDAKLKTRRGPAVD